MFHLHDSLKTTPPVRLETSVLKVSLPTLNFVAISCCVSRLNDTLGMFYFLCDSHDDRREINKVAENFSTRSRC